MSKAFTRREVLAASLGAAGVLTAGELSAQRRSAPPNIIYIMADDLGYADVGCYGRGEIKTPNIDALAKQGLRFTQAYANSAVCSATRLALITGRYQYRLRLGLEEPLAATQDIGLPPEHPTLPSLLRKLGYSTTLIGKWHLGYMPKFGPLQSGYEHFYGFRSGAVDYFSHKDPAGNADFWEDDVPLSQNGYMTELLGERAVRVINEARGQPFFISLHFNAPHWPWELPGDAAESKRIADTRLWHRDGGTRKIYGSMVENMDAQIGRVLRALRSKGLSDNTLVIFTSDNGGERFSDMWPFSGQKTELLEGGLRIPAVVSWPARLPKRRDVDQMAMSMDWLPTLLAAAGGAPDPAYPSDGINLLPYLSGAAPVNRKLYWRYKSNHQRAMRDGDYKFLKMLDNTYLFNVIEDPLERANLKERRPEIYQRMLQDWQQWNAGMLPELAESYGDAVEGKDQADHISAGPALLTPDD
ncbi:MAG: sulfatase-like hydrolase/transferase [Steroidobacteraceae bacterium]